MKIVFIFYSLVAFFMNREATHKVYQARLSSDFEELQVHASKAFLLMNPFLHIVKKGPINGPNNGFFLKIICRFARIADF